MEQTNYSKTAILTAGVRAFHFVHEKQKIFADPLAHLFVTPAKREAFEVVVIDGLANKRPDIVASSVDRTTLVGLAMRLGLLAPLFLTRARYIEDSLTEAIGRGVRQYVIIGAGLDTYAFRQPAGTQLQVFELDHPSTQSLKQKRLADARLVTPAHLHFVAADLERESVATALERTRFDVNVPTLFSLAGVTYYLTRDAINGTLQSVRSIAAADSELIFDYLEVDFFKPDNASERIRRAKETLRNWGEPLLSGFEPATIGSELLALGFTLIEDLSPAMILERYIRDRSDGFRALEYFHFVRAQVQ